MKTIRLVTFVSLLIALLGVTSCTSQPAPQATASVTATPSGGPLNTTGAVADPCKTSLISGYPAGSHAHPVVMLKLSGSRELEDAKASILGSVRSENDEYGFAVKRDEFFRYLSSEEQECANSVPGQVDYYLTSVADAPHLIGALQLGGPSLFVSHVQSA